MAAAHLKVLHAGPLVTIQDAGRPGNLRIGAPRSGPMDRPAFAVANALLGNPEGTTGIEVSLGGLTLTCQDGSVTVAIAGGAFRVQVDGKPLKTWGVVTLRAGSKLAISPGATGSWTYLAFAGRLRSKRWLGSAATHSTSGFGGGAIKAGDTLVVEEAEERADRERELTPPAWLQPKHDIAIVLGPQDRHFSSSTVQALVSEPFALTDAFDRMGVRLAGPSLTPSVSLDIPSEALSRGSIQVAGDGVASVLLADHQSTGGFPKIATLVSSDVDRIAQLRSKDIVRFHSVAPAEAVLLARAEAKRLAELVADAARPPASLLSRLLTSNLIDGVVSGAEPD